MASAIPDPILDEILGIQLSVAWAGEGRCEPKRLGWWETDLTDPAGGDALLGRLLPRTHAWAGLHAVRLLAIEIDRKARSAHARADQMVSLFQLGFEVDELLEQRLAELKVAGRPPESALPSFLGEQGHFDAPALSARLRSLAPDAEFKIVAGGRQMKGRAPEDPAAMARALAAALVPFAAEYSFPFFLRG